MKTGFAAADVFPEKKAIQKTFGAHAAASSFLPRRKK
jgi:hypothetical protein